MGNEKRLFFEVGNRIGPARALSSYHYYYGIISTEKRTNVFFLFYQNVLLQFYYFLPAHTLCTKIQISYSYLQNRI